MVFPKMPAPSTFVRDILLGTRTISCMSLDSKFGRIRPFRPGASGFVAPAPAVVYSAGSACTVPAASATLPPDDTRRSALANSLCKRSYSVNNVCVPMSSVVSCDQDNVSSDKRICLSDVLSCCLFLDPSLESCESSPLSPDSSSALLRDVDGHVVSSLDFVLSPPLPTASCVSMPPVDGGPSCAKAFKSGLPTPLAPFRSLRGLS